MGTPYLADSNVLIDFLMGRLPSDGAEIVAQLINNGQLYTSVIVKIEILGYKGEEERQLFRKLLEQIVVLPLDEAVTDTTILLRRAYTIKLPDAIIAATALHHRHTLLTRNRKDFARIDGLVSENLHER